MGERKYRFDSRETIEGLLSFLFVIFVIGSSFVSCAGVGAKQETYYYAAKSSGEEQTERIYSIEEVEPEPHSGKTRMAAIDAGDYIGGECGWWDGYEDGYIDGVDGMDYGRSYGETNTFEETTKESYREFTDIFNVSESNDPYSDDYFRSCESAYEASYEGGYRDGYAYGQTDGGWD